MALNYKRLRRYVEQHGNVSLVDSQDNTRLLKDGEPDVFDLVEKADRFLWDGILRSRREMEDLVSQSERGLKPGCAECDRLERELIAARKLDRDEKNSDGKREMPALHVFQEHRHSHQ